MALLALYHILYEYDCRYFDLLAGGQYRILIFSLQGKKTIIIGQQLNVHYYMHNIL